MSLVLACQGSWFSDRPGEHDDSLAVKFGKMLRRQAGFHLSYESGVGTAGGWMGRVLGGAFGMGTRRRTEDLFTAWEMNQDCGPLVMAGWSRGCDAVVRAAHRIVYAGGVLDLLVLIDPVYGSWRTGQPFSGAERDLPEANRVVLVRALHERRRWMPAREYSPSPRTDWVSGDHRSAGLGYGVAKCPAVHAAQDLGYLHKGPCTVRPVPCQSIEVCKERRSVWRNGDVVWRSLE